MTENPFNITREEILELAASKLADRFADHEDLENYASKLIRERVEERIKTHLNSAIEKALSSEMERLLSEVVCPVDVWGKPTGEPTTIRNALAIRCKDFWMEKVDESGKSSAYYGAKYRHEQLFGKIVEEEFSKAIKQNIVNIVGALKDAVTESATKSVKDHIDSLIKVNTKGDRQ